MLFKAKVKGKDEVVIGDSLVKEFSCGCYVIVVDGMSWQDGNEWAAGTWEFIEYETLEISK